MPAFWTWQGLEFQIEGFPVLPDFEIHPVEVLIRSVLGQPELLALEPYAVTLWTLVHLSRPTDHHFEVDIACRAYHEVLLLHVSGPINKIRTVYPMPNRTGTSYRFREIRQGHVSAIHFHNSTLKMKT